MGIAHPQPFYRYSKTLLTMTDRVNALIVILDEPMRVGDAEHLIKAIRMLKHVHSVHGNVEDTADFIAAEKARRVLRNKLYDLINTL